MKKLIALMFLAAVLAFAQEPAHGGGEAAVSPGGHADTHAEAAAKQGEGHAEEAMPNEIWWKWANFAILAGVLGWLISKNAGPFFRSRSEEIAKGIAEATRTREEAEARAAEIERRVSNLSVEVEHIRQQSHEEIVREGERVRAETEAQIRKVQAQAQAEIESAAKHAAHDLKAYSAQLAMQLAEQQIRDRMTPDAQSWIADSFAAELKQKVGKS